MPPNPNPEKGDGNGKECRRAEKKKSVSSLVDELLSDIYGKAELKRKQSLTTAGEWIWHESDQRNRGNPRFRSNLKQLEAKSWSKDIAMLREEIAALESLVAEESNNLVKYLKRKDYLLARREAHYDVITAVIHAISRKTRDDMKMKFSLTPGTETGFSQWLDAMKMVAQLPGGVPSEFRTKLWLQLSERHLSEQNIDWEKAEGIIFNEWTNPDDEELGVQIVKDLHRTGCSLFCGAQEQNQALLKRVLLAYARWNKNVGYCQGFNMLAALILQVMDRDEKNAVKVMIYLIEGVLPESYFANNLRGLSVDMAVFRDLLRLRLPKLSKHLEALQNDTNSGTSYEPPLTNVFTMQWFLTLFSNCLPQQTVLRVWDLVFLHGNEVLLRTALAIWGILQDRIMSVESADEFYSIMGVVTREMLEFGLMDANNLIKMIVMVDPFPNELQELREKYLYNISPWTQSVQSAARKGIKLFYSDPEDQDDTEDEDKIALATAYGVFRRRESGSREVQPMGPTLDISVLKQQYAKLRQRQRQAHIIISAACSSSIPANLSSVPTVSVNHLLMGKSALVNKGRRIGPPEGSIPPPKNRAVKGTDVGNHSAKEKVFISGETLNWKDAGKRRCSTTESKKFSNTDKNAANNKPKTLGSCNGLSRDGHFGEEEEEDAGRKRRSSTSSASSSSTELCDDEFHRLSDFDPEEANLGRGSEDEVRSTAEPFSDRCEEARKCAAELLKDIEKAIDSSERLTHLRTPDNNVGKAEDYSDSLSTSIHDNIIPESPGFGDLKKEFLKSEPEVPIAGNVINNVENRIFDRSKLERDEMKIRKERDRRKSDLALSVIKENLEMLSKFSQKSAMREESGAGNISRYETCGRDGEGNKEGMMTMMMMLKERSEGGGREGLETKEKNLVVEEVARDVKILQERTDETETKGEILSKTATVVVQEEGDRPKSEQIVKQEEDTAKRVREIIRKADEGDRLKSELTEGKREDRTEIQERIHEEGRLKSEITGRTGKEDRPKEMRQVKEVGQASSEIKRDELLRRSVIIEEIRGGERGSGMTEGKEEEDSMKRPGEVKQRLNDESRSRTEAVGGTRDEDFSKRRREVQEGLREEDRLRKEVSGERHTEDLPMRAREIQDGVHEEHRPKSETTRKKHEEEQPNRLRETQERMREKDELKSQKRHEEQPRRERKVQNEGGPSRIRKVEEKGDSEPSGSTVAEKLHEEERLGKETVGEDTPKTSRETQGRILEEDRPKSGDKREEEGVANGKRDTFVDDSRKGEEPGGATQRKTTTRVNKEVNTDITIATDLDASPQKKDHHADDFLISLISSKPVHKSPEKFPCHDGKEPCSSVRPFGRGDLVDRWKKESERIESKIEISKSDWDLKMKRIAELETTTREKLNEIKSKSIVHRHRSLDRFEGREREKRKSPIPRIHVPSDDIEDVEWRKKKISALSFDEITSRTEKLLGANLSLETGHRRGAGKAYEYYSSPTSPEYRPRKRSEYSSPKRWKQPAEEDWLTITEENGRTAVDLVSPGRKAESSAAGFNPFPTRSHSRPKELGVRLGMYPPSPEGAHPSKKSQ